MILDILLEILVDIWKYISKYYMCGWQSIVKHMNSPLSISLIINLYCVGTGFRVVIEL